MKHVGRGLFEFCRFTDTYGAVVRVQSSSAAGVPRAWIFVAGGITDLGGANPNDGAAHLSPGQAKRLRTALDKWLAHVGDGARRNTATRGKR